MARVIRGSPKENKRRSKGGKGRKQKSGALSRSQPSKAGKSKVLNCFVEVKMTVEGSISNGLVPRGVGMSWVVICNLHYYRKGCSSVWDRKVW